MKGAGILLTVALAMGLLACGGGGNSASTTTNPATGAWSETFTSPTNQPLGSFTFNMTQNGTMLTGSSMSFANMGSLASCFGAGTTMTGQMGVGMMNGGSMTMSMSWTPAGGSATNTMTMQGNMATGMGSGSGTFTLTGQTPGCSSQTGAFTMTHTSSQMMM